MLHKQIGQAWHILGTAALLKGEDFSMKDLMQNVTRLLLIIRLFFCSINESSILQVCIFDLYLKPYVPSS
jgi:hypothetical protein